MPRANDTYVESLRWQFYAALATHSQSKRALLEAMIDGTPPLPALVAAEVKAKAFLEDVRAKLLAEMTNAITAGSEPAPPKI